MQMRSARALGRDSELALMRRALADARAGHGGAVFLVGETGIGKSRLVAEATGLAVTESMRVLRGRSSTIGPVVPLRPLAEAVMGLLRTGERVDEDALGPYRTVLGRLIPEWNDSAQEQGSMIVLGEAVLRLLAVTGRTRASLLVLEDLHDAETETLAVVEYLIDNLGQLPVLLVATLRTDPSDALELARSAARRAAGVSLELRPLTRAEADAMVAACLDCEVGQVPRAALDRIWHDSAGNPFVVEELLLQGTSDGWLVRDEGVWRVVGDPRGEVPSTLVQGVVQRTDKLGPQARSLLSAAAVLGRRFPLSVVQRMTAADDRTLLSHLHLGVAAHLVVSDEPAPDWYAFRHPLTAQALLAQLTPTARAALAASAADAVEELHPGLPGEWCALTASLREEAGDAAAAGALYSRAGRRALATGAVGTAVTLLERAERLLAEGRDPDTRAEALEALLPALAETGDLARASGLADHLSTLVGHGLDTSRLAALHVRLAEVAHRAGRWTDGKEQVAKARALLAARPDEAVAAQADVIAAYLALDEPGPLRTQFAERLANSAISAAERHGLPLVACQAWELLGVLARERDPKEAEECLLRAMETAERHALPLQRMYAHVRLAGSDWLATGEPAHLLAAREEAERLGAVTVVHTVDAILAMETALLGRFEEADARCEENLAMAVRLRLKPVARYLLMVRATSAAHRGRRAAMEAAITEFERYGGRGSLEEPLVLGMAQVFCALLEEDRALARRLLADLDALQAGNPSIFHLGGRHGIGLLLAVLAGEAGRDRHQEVAASSAGHMRWNQIFVCLADAVLLGREHEPLAAERAVRRAHELAAPYPTALHLGNRLVAESAHAAGWGDPEGWLHQAEDHFRRFSVTPVASACRALLRGMGAPVRQHRTGSQLIPADLRALGVTVREYEVFQLLAERLANKAVAARLSISPRTVEKHIASLLTKTGCPNRATLCDYAARAQP